MLHYAARQREQDKLWDYTCRDKYGTHPVGYCMPYSRIDPDKGANVTMLSEEQKDKLRSSKDKYHDTGHSTKEEAENCYKDYMLSEYTNYDHRDEEHMSRCVVCNMFTQRYVTVGGWYLFVLCDVHANRETLEILYEVHEIYEGAE